MSAGPKYEKILTLEDVKHGEIVVRFYWTPISADSDDPVSDVIDLSDVTTSCFVASVYIDHCSNLVCFHLISFLQFL